MKRWSLRVAYANVTLAALIGALTAEPALAHLDLRPRLVVQGELTDVRVELPQLRPGAPPKELEIEGEGIEASTAELQGTLGSDTFWTVRLRAEGEPGIVPLVLRAVYDDGRSVEVDQQLTVVPAEGSSFPWPAVAVGAVLAVAFAAVAVGAVLAVAFAAVALRLARRKA